MAQSLDAIIDSFPAEPVAGAPQRPDEAGEDKAEAGLAASPPDAPAPGTATDAPEPGSSTGSAIAALQMGISSLFDSLGSIEQRAADDVRPVEEPPAPSAPPLGLDMSMLEVRVPARPALQPESGPPAAASPDGAQLPSRDPEPQAHKAQGDDVQTEEVRAGELELDMSMLERSPARPVLQPESDPSGAGSPYGDPFSPAGGEAQADRIRAGEVETDERRVAEPALVRVTDAPAEPDALARYPGEPPFSPGFGDVGGSSPSVFAEPPQDAPPFIERPASPAFAEPSELAYAPRFAEPMAPPSFRGPLEPSSAHGFPEPQVMPAYTDPAESAAQPMFDAAAKIAAEAQATAEALDNLRGLLAHGAPGQQEPIELPGHDPALDLGHTPGYASVRFNLHGDQTPFPSSGPAALMPMPLPVPPERSGIKGIYVLGFLTGLGLSLMAGIALYILINMI